MNYKYFLLLVSIALGLGTFSPVNSMFRGIKSTFGATWRHKKKIIATGLATQAYMQGTTKENKNKLLCTQKVALNVARAASFSVGALASQAWQSYELEKKMGVGSSEPLTHDEQIARGHLFNCLLNSGYLDMGCLDSLEQEQGQLSLDELIRQSRTVHALNTGLRNSIPEMEFKAHLYDLTSSYLGIEVSQNRLVPYFIDKESHNRKEIECAQNSPVNPADIEAICREIVKCAAKKETHERARELLLLVALYGPEYRTVALCDTAINELTRDARVVIEEQEQAKFSFSLKLKKFFDTYR